MTAERDLRSDEALIASYARSGDHRALGELIDRNWPLAFRVARRVLGDPAAAEDAAQEAIVALARNAARFEQGRPFGPWFQTLVTNAARMQARSARRRQRHETVVARRLAGASAPAEGEARVLAGEVDAALAGLELEDREAVVLHYYEGFTHEEAGVVLGVPATTARSRVRRGVERLREALSPAGSALSVVELERSFARARADGPAFSVPVQPSLEKVEALVRAASRVALAAKAAIVAVSLSTIGVVALALPKLPLAAKLPGGDDARAPIEKKPDAGETGDRSGRPPGPPQATPPQATPPEATPPAKTGGEGRASGAVSPVKPDAPLTAKKGFLVGHVLDARTRAPLEGAELYLSTRGTVPGHGEDGSDGFASNLEPDGKSDASGAFEAKIPVEIDSEDDDATVTEVVVVVLARGHDAFVRRLEPAVFERVADLLLEPGDGARVRGRVVDATTKVGLPGVKLVVSLSNPARESGRIDGEHEQAVTTKSPEPSPEPTSRKHGVRVWHDTHRPGSCWPRLVTRGDGSFALAGLPEGDIDIELDGGQKLVAAPEKTRSSAAPREVVIEATRAASLLVKALGHDGRPEPRALVAVEYPRTKRQSGWSTVEQLHEVGDEGFALGSLAPGAYAVKAAFPKAGESDDETMRRCHKSPDAEETVTLEPGDEKTITVRPGALPSQAGGPTGSAPAAPRGSLTVNVRFASGAPADAVPVWVVKADASSWGDARKSKTDDHGVTRFESLDPAAWKIQVSESSSGKPLKTFDVGAGATAIDLAIPDRVEARGIVVDEAGRPIEGARVEIHVMQGSACAGNDGEATTGADGTFALTVIPVGRVFVDAEAPGFTRESSSDWPEEGNTGNLRIALAKAARSVVVRARVQGLDGARVSAYLITHGPCPWGQSGDVDGGGAVEVVWEALPSDVSGTIVLRIGEKVPVTRAFGPHDTELDLGELDLKDGATIRGRVTGDEGWIAKGGFTSVSFGGSLWENIYNAKMYNANIERDGTFEIRGVPLEAVKLHLAVAEPAADGHWREANLELDPATVARGDLGTIELKLRPKERGEERP